MPLMAIGWSVRVRICQNIAQSCIWDPAVEINNPLQNMA
jgi:hypothetical protein